MVKILVFGSRSITNESSVKKILNNMMRCGELEGECVIISGGAPGVDSIAEQWAIEREIESEIHRPNYTNGAGSSAPLMRNKKMADLADFGVAIWDGKSRGTVHTISCLVRMGKHCMVMGVDK